MIILGLTGSVAMGKTTVAGIFGDEGVPVHDADAAAHRLTQPDGPGFGPVSEAFPGCVKDGAIDRQALGREAFGAPERRRRLEAILHPLVRADRDEWLEARRAEDAELVVLDIPLLYETGGEADCDAVAVVSARPFQQHRRAMARPGMTGKKLAGILKAQTGDAEKRERADFVVPTGYGVTASRWFVRRIIGQLLRRAQGGDRNG